MEFRYDCKTHTWTRTPNNEKRFTITTPGGNVVVIPDFIESEKEYKHPEICTSNYRHCGGTENIEYLHGLLPFIQTRQRELRVCLMIPTDQWAKSELATCQNLFILANGVYNNIMNILTIIDNQAMQKQLAFYKSVFDHIREKNSSLDEFMKLAGECLLPNETCTNKP